MTGVTNLARILASHQAPPQLQVQGIPKGTYYVLKSFRG